MSDPRPAEPTAPQPPDPPSSEPPVAEPATIDVPTSAAAVAGVLVVGRVFALVKELAVAAWFGNRETTDAFYLGWLAPAVLANVVGAALETAIIPHLIRRRRERLAAWQLFRATARRVVNATIVVAAILMLAASPIMALLAGSRGAAEAGAAPVNLDAAVECLRITAVYLPAHVFIFLLSGALAANGRFAASSSWTIVSSAATLAVLWTGSDQTGRPAASLAYAVTIGYGAALFWMIALTAFIAPRQSSRPTGAPQLRAGIAAIFADAVPLAIAGLAPQINALVDSIMAARLFEGAVSALQRAVLISNTLVLLATRSLFRPVLASLSEPADAPTADPNIPPKAAALAAAIRKAREDARLSDVLRPAIYWGTPIALLLYTLAEPLTRLALERGAFTAADTAPTAAALRLLAPGAVFAAIAVIATAWFAAAGRSRDLLVCAAIAVTAHVALNIGLLSAWPDEHRHAALALSGSLTAMLTAGLLLFRVGRAGGPVDWAALVGVAGRAAFAAAGLLFAVRMLTAGAVSLPEPAAVAVLSAAGLAAYLAASALLGAPELKAALARLRRNPRPE